MVRLLTRLQGVGCPCTCVSCRLSIHEFNEHPCCHQFASAAAAASRCVYVCSHKSSAVQYCCSPCVTLVRCYSLVYGAASHTVCCFWYCRFWHLGCRWQEPRRGASGHSWHWLLASFSRTPLLSLVLNTETTSVIRLSRCCLHHTLARSVKSGCSLSPSRITLACLIRNGAESIIRARHSRAL